MEKRSKMAKNTKTDTIEAEEIDAVEAVEEAVSEEAVQDPNSLQASDLNTMATVIEATAQRGAIRANEMQIVGQLYSKLNHFLILNGIRQAPGSEETAPAEEAPAENKITGENEND
jgi:hypothetical protein|tara:strand:- start:103 stop:450 length:348 start_codon:yes stop_codon:yes gene_type:complete